MEEVKTPIPSAPQDLPATNGGVGDPDPLSLFQDAGFFSNTFTNTQTSKMSSPTWSISTVSDLTPTELGEDIGEDNAKQIPIRHETFYLEDGNVEIVCGYTIFQIHSPVVSFSSPDLLDILSPSILLNAPMPEGCPWVVFKDSADDFAILLRMIYTPGYVPPPLDVGSANWPDD